MRVVLYTNAGPCPLCDDAREVLDALTPGLALDVVEVPVDRDPRLAVRYALRVPVVEVDGVELMFGKLDPRALEAALRARRQGPAPSVHSVAEARLTVPGSDPSPAPVPPGKPAPTGGGSKLSEALGFGSAAPETPSITMPGGAAREPRRAFSSPLPPSDPGSGETASAGTNPSAAPLDLDDGEHGSGAFGELGRLPPPADAMVTVRGGAFVFGEDKRRVSVPEFEIDRDPVTNADYERFVLATGHRPPLYWRGGRCPDDLRDHPVVGVDLFDAIAYARWAGKDLPYEDEWERAARGTDGRTYPWGDEPDLAANTARTGLKMTLPVGFYAKNVSPEGCRDMVGNAWELTLSPAPGGGVVVRGGSWFDFALYAKTYFRSSARVDARNGTIGFRCVRRAAVRADAPRAVVDGEIEAAVAARKHRGELPDPTAWNPDRRDLVPDVRRLRAVVTANDEEAGLEPRPAAGPSPSRPPVRKAFVSAPAATASPLHAPAMPAPGSPSPAGSTPGAPPSPVVVPLRSPAPAPTAAAAAAPPGPSVVPPRLAFPAPPAAVPPVAVPPARVPPATLLPATVPPATVPPKVAPPTVVSPTVVSPKLVPATGVPPTVGPLPVEPSKVAASVPARAPTAPPPSEPYPRPLAPPTGEVRGGVPAPAPPTGAPGRLPVAPLNPLAVPGAPAAAPAPPPPAPPLVGPPKPPVAPASPMPSRAAAPPPTSVAPPATPTSAGPASVGPASVGPGSGLPGSARPATPPVAPAAPKSPVAAGPVVPPAPVAPLATTTSAAAFRQAADEASRAVTAPATTTSSTAADETTSPLRFALIVMGFLAAAVFLVTLVLQSGRGNADVVEDDPVRLQLPALVKDDADGAFPVVLSGGSTTPDTVLLESGTVLLVFADAAHEAGRETAELAVEMHRRLRAYDVRTVLVVPREVVTSDRNADASVLKEKLAALGVTGDVPVLLDVADERGGGHLRRVRWQVPDANAAVVLRGGIEVMRVTPPASSGALVRAHLAPLVKTAANLGGLRPVSEGDAGGDEGEGDDGPTALDRPPRSPTVPPSMR